MSHKKENMKRVLAMTVTATLALCMFLTSDAQAHPAWGIAVDRDGQVYFSDLKTIWKINAQGQLSVFRAGGDRHTHDLNVDEAGNLYGADNSYEPATQRFFSAIWKMTPAGGFSYLLAPTDNPPKGISIWKDRDGNMYHATNYPGRELLVLKRTPRGDVTALVGSSNAARNFRQGVPYSVGGMAFGADGALYFTHGANVSMIAMGGALRALVRDLVVENASENAAPETLLFGIAVDAWGNAFVADYGNRRVLKISPDGKRTAVVRAEESWYPTGVAARDDGLYVLEEGHTPTHKPIGTRVRKLSSDGTVTVLATVGENTVSSGSPAADIASSRERSEKVDEPKQNISYVLLGTGMAVFPLAIIGWLVWSRCVIINMEHLNRGGHKTHSGSL